MHEGETPEQSLSSPLSLPPSYLLPSPHCSTSCIWHPIQGPPRVHSRELCVPGKGGVAAGEGGGAVKRAGWRRGEAGRGSYALEMEEP